MKIFNVSDNSFYKDLNEVIQNRSQQNLHNIDEDVKEIINDISLRGDEALFEYANKFETA